MIIVFGSVSMDMTVKLKSFPKSGETVLTPSYTMNPGGRGANQAMAAAAAGSQVAMIGKVGDDGPGLRIMAHLKRNGVRTTGIATSDVFPTGMSVFTKERDGEKRTIVASGANIEVSADQVPKDVFHKDHVLLVQMEVPMEQNALVMKHAQEQGSTVIMNMAPALSVPKELLSLVDYLIVNQIEARKLAKKLKIDIEKDTTALAHSLAREGRLMCIVTLGPEGVVAVDPKGKGWRVHAMKLDEVVDNSGAGDCFSGTFAACIHEKKSVQEALKMATVASGLSCTREGAMESYPYLADTEKAMEDFPKAIAI